MGALMRITIEEISTIYNRLDEINDIPFENLEIYENGKQIVLSARTIESIKFIGISNSYVLNNKLYNDIT